jgi:hypothetical protein
MGGISEQAALKVEFSKTVSTYEQGMPYEDGIPRTTAAKPQRYRFFCEKEGTRYFQRLEAIVPIQGRGPLDRY